MVPQYIQTPERGDHNLTTWNLRAGRYTEAISALEALRRDKGVDVSNNLMWAHVMASKLDDELERETLRMANDHESQASLHTAAMVLLERDRVLDAADYGMKRHRMLGGGEPDEAQWLFRGRLLQVLGFRDLSSEALGKVRDDVELCELARRNQQR